MKRDSRRALQGLKMTGLGRQLRRMGIPKKRTAQGMFYGVKRLEKPAEAEVEKVEKNFSQIPQISLSAEKEFSQSPQCPQSAEKNFSLSSLSSLSAENNFSQISQISQIPEKEFSQISQISQISENPEEPQDSFDSFGSYSESKLTPHQRPD